MNKEKEIPNAVDQVKTSIDRVLSEIGEKAVTQGLIQAIELATNTVERYDASRPDEKQLAARNVAIYSNNLAHLVRREEDADPSWIAAADQLHADADALSKLAEKATKQRIRTIRTLGGQRPATSPEVAPEPALDEIKEQLDRHVQLIQKDLDTAQSRARKLEASFASVQAELERVTEQSKKELAEIQRHKDEADKLRAYLSSKSFAGDYENAAANEGDYADKMRMWSMLAFGVAGSLVIIALLQSIFGEAPWRDNLSRLGLIFFMTLPAGYLARESSKHRAQQYKYQRRSLELNAFDPFLAPLSDEQKSEIRVAAAQKMFSEDEAPEALDDTGIPNWNEIIPKILKRLERLK